MANLLTGAVTSAASSWRKHRSAPSCNHATAARAAFGDPSTRCLRKRFRQGIGDEHPTSAGFAAMRLNRQIQGEFFVDPARITSIADQQVSGVIGGELGGDAL